MWRQTAPIVRMTLGGHLICMSCAAQSDFTDECAGLNMMLDPQSTSEPTTCGTGGAVRRIVMQDDVKAAVAFVEAQITRLLSGRCELWEFVMTGVSCGGLRICCI